MIWWSLTHHNGHKCIWIQEDEWIKNKKTIECYSKIEKKKQFLPNLNDQKIYENKIKPKDGRRKKKLKEKSSV